MPFVELHAQFPEVDAEALAVLARSASRDGMIAVELGSWCGCSSAVIANVVKAACGTLYCVDRWDVYPGDKLETETLNQIFRESDVLRVFRTNMRELGLADVVVPIAAAGDQAQRLIAEECADLIFIDADHSYKAVKNDILGYWPKLKIGGILCGHDYDKYYAIEEDELHEHSDEDYYRNMHCGVIRAVDELFGDRLQWPGTSRIWSVTKRQRAIGAEHGSTEP